LGLGGISIGKVGSIIAGEFCKRGCVSTKLGEFGGEDFVGVLVTISKPQHLLNLICVDNATNTAPIAIDKLIISIIY
jgi:hypothetical protein